MSPRYRKRQDPLARPLHNLLARNLKRLMDEQEQFEAFLDRLRAAKDKREFDTFMDERADAARHAHDDADEADEVEPRNDEPRS